jgi:hypothetical protein
MSTRIDRAVMVENLWSPSTGDTYTMAEGQWLCVDHYTHEWFHVDAPPSDARPCSDVRLMEAGRHYC